MFVSYSPDRRTFQLMKWGNPAWRQCSIQAIYRNGYALFVRFSGLSNIFFVLARVFLKADASASDSFGKCQTFRGLVIVK